MSNFPRTLVDAERGNDQSSSRAVVEAASARHAGALRGGLPLRRQRLYRRK